MFNLFYICSCQQYFKDKKEELALKKAVSQKPNDIKAVLALGEYYFLNSHFTKAKTEFEIAQRLEANNIEAIAGLSKTYFFLDKFEIAEKLLLDKLKIYPNSYLLNSTLGLEYFWIDELDKSFIYLKKAIEIEPYHHEPYDGLIYIYEKKGNIDTAILTAKKAIKMFPDVPDGHAIIALLYAQHKKDFKNATIEINNALRLDPNNKKAKDRLKVIELLKKRYGITDDYKSAYSK